MRRKSERNKAKASPEKVEKEKPRRGRPSRKRKKSSSEEDAESAASGSEKDARQDAAPEGDQQWRVKAGGDPGHPHKLKICLARPTERSSDTETRTRRRENPPPAPAPAPERRRSRHRSRRVSNREPEAEAPEPEPSVPSVPSVPEPETSGPEPELVVVKKLDPVPEVGELKEKTAPEPVVEDKVEPPGELVESKVKTSINIPVVAIVETVVQPVKIKRAIEPPKIEKVIETPKIEKVIETPKVEKTVETPKVEKTVETPKIEKVVEPPKIKPVTEAPKVEKVTETPKVEKVIEPPKIEPVTEVPKVEKVIEAPKVEKVIEAPKDEKVIEAAKVEPVVEAPKVEPVVAAPKVEAVVISKAETTTEIISETKCVIKRKSEPKVETKVVEKPEADPIPVVVVSEKPDTVQIPSEAKPIEQIKKPVVEEPMECEPVVEKIPMETVEKPTELATNIAKNESDIQIPVVEPSRPKSEEKQSQPSIDSEVSESVKKSEPKPKVELADADTKSKADTPAKATLVSDVNSTTQENEPDTVVVSEDVAANSSTQSKSQSSKETPKVTIEKEIKSPKRIIEPVKDDNVKTKIVHISPRAAERRDAAEEKHSKILTHKDKFSDSKEDRAEEFQKTRSFAENVSSSNSSRKRKWGSRPKLIKTPSVNISTDSLKNLISNVEPVSAEEALSDIKPKDPPESKPKKIVLDDIKKPNGKYGVSDTSNEKDVVGNLTHRKISIVNDEIAKLHSPPSPPKYKSSTVLYITNLVRPFTLPQLKNLLQRTGRIVENGFWIDKIKSKCYVQYETEDEAIETRHALHGVTWPVSNPKTLNVDFGSKEAMDEIIASTEEDKSTVVDNWSKDSINRDLKVTGLELDDKSFEKRTVVREWDLGKGDGKDEFLDRPNNRLRDGNELERRKRRSSKSRSPSPARKFKKKEEEAPSKLLDDLFKKTKTTPCIYWLPLNAETILVKEEQRRKHMAEHERRMEELRKAAEEHRMSRHAPHHASSHRHR